MKKALRTSVPIIFMVTLFLFAFQNCGEVPFDQSNLDSSSNFPLNATESPKIEAAITMDLSKDMASVQASLYRGLLLFRESFGPDQGVINLKLSYGHNLVADDGQQAAVCHFDPGGSQNKDSFGAMVISIGCIFSDLSFNASSDQTSLSAILFSSLELLFQQEQQGAQLLTVSPIANGYKLEDDNSSFSCTNTQGSFACHYLAK